ncbi:hypothetical protein QBC41DRAFT_306457 [Cercophora samala]|uniref:Uncharacterized protein n=1 Tax=Cercophora samala TaxID=330535 RepID=A0AA39Z6H4_9PEZI|nr:hypothetical protein QBC41DRAFT_306457 [Cercophora samala]
MGNKIHYTLSHRATPDHGSPSSRGNVHGCRSFASGLPDPPLLCASGILSPIPPPPNASQWDTPDRVNAAGFGLCAFEDFKPTLHMSLLLVLRQRGRPRPRSPTSPATYCRTHAERDGRRGSLPSRACSRARLQTIYHDLMPQFDVAGPAELVVARGAEVPVQCTFGVVVASLLAVHIVSCVLVAVLYAVVAKDTLLGEAWSAVGQLFGPDTEAWLESAGGRTDEEMKGEMGLAGEGRMLVGIGRGEGGEVRIRRKTPGDKVDGTGNLEREDDV